MVLFGGIRFFLEFLLKYNHRIQGKKVVWMPITEHFLKRLMEQNSFLSSQNVALSEQNAAMAGQISQLTKTVESLNQTIQKLQEQLNTNAKKQFQVTLQ